MLQPAVSQRIWLLRQAAARRLGELPLLLRSLPPRCWLSLPMLERVRVAAARRAL